MFPRSVLRTMYSHGANSGVNIGVPRPTMVRKKVIIPASGLVPRGYDETRLFHTTGMNGKAENDADPKGGENPKLIPNEEWAKKLTPEQYFCTRECGTEPPFSGQYLNHKAEGIYACIGCGNELFSSKAKFDSGSGWPSYHSAVVDKTSNTTNVIRRKDISHGMVREEILCNNCNAHLGHVFNDGPEPTGERYCVNSVALKFIPKKLS